MVLDDLSDFLTSGGISTTKYKGFLPPTPDEALLLVATGGFSAVHAFSAVAGAAVEERPTVQITRRSPVPARAAIEMNVIYRMLDGMGDRSINGTRYFWVEAMQPPFPLGEDDSQRSLVVCNFRIHKAMSTSTST